MMPPPVARRAGSHASFPPESAYQLVWICWVSKARDKRAAAYSVVSGSIAGNSPTRRVCDQSAPSCDAAAHNVSTIAKGSTAGGSIAACAASSRAAFKRARLMKGPAIPSDPFCSRAMRSGCLRRAACMARRSFSIVANCVGPRVSRRTTTVRGAEGWTALIRGSDFPA